MPNVVTVKPDGTDRRSRSLSCSWGIAIGLSVAGFCVASGLMLLDMRGDARDRAATAQANLLAAISQDVARNVELYDLSLRAVVDGLAEPGFADLSPRMQDLVLYDRSATASDLGAMLVLDTQGKVVRASARGFVGADLSDREYFQALRAAPDGGLFISKPFRRRVTGDDEVIALARALRAPDGAFSGVVVGTLRLAYLRDLFAKPDLGPRGAVNLFLLDGTCVMRAPYDAGSVGRSLAGTDNFRRLSASPSGSFEADSAVDGVRRTYAFARIGRLPLILDVALAEADVLAPWRIKASVIGTALALLCGMVGFLARAKARSEADHRLLADNAIDVVVRLDRSLRRTYVSPSSSAVLGYDPPELLGRHPRQIIHEADWMAFEGWLEGVRAGNALGEAVFRVKRKDGALRWVEGRCRTMADGRSLIAVLRDVSERRAAEERAADLTERLERLANVDGLTDLANRRRFDAVLTEAAASAAAGPHSLSVLLLDVDRFKVFNDRYGHQRGDACLRAVARAAEGAVTHPGALVARYGGEEIAVVLPRASAVIAEDQAERVRRAVEGLAWAHVGGEGGVVTVSVGCATADLIGDDPDGADLVTAADANLYEAKRLGRNRVVAGRGAPSHRPPSVEEARLAAVGRLDRMDALVPSEAFDRIADLAAHVFGTPAAFVSVVRRDEVTLVGRHGTEARVAPRAEVFCAQTVLGDEPFVVPDASADARFAALPIVREGCRFYAGAPFADPTGGGAVGALCIVAENAMPMLDSGQRAILAGLAALVTDEVARRAGTSLRGVRAPAGEADGPAPLGLPNVA